MIVFVYSFSEDGVETAETAYALGLAYTNVQDDDAESILWRFVVIILFYKNRALGLSFDSACLLPLLGRMRGIL